MSRPPLLRLSEEEIEYITQHAWHDINNDVHLSAMFRDNKPMRDWLINRLLMTADHFKIRYQQEEYAGM